ncbi:MAG: PAS domain S-box protein [Phycisphaerae bacterium]|nr:PAS domain S-box protein [Phycisphaerae bacterium]
MNDSQEASCYSTRELRALRERVAALEQALADRRDTEDRLLTLSSRYQAILDAVPDIIMEVNAQRVYTWANQAGIDFFGKDVIGKEAESYFEGQQDTYERVQPLFHGDESVIYIESWQRRRDGQKRLLAWWCRVLKGGDGAVTGALSTARDITEIRQSQEDLRLNQFGVDNAAHPIFWVRPDGGFHYVNNVACDLLEYSREELLSMGVPDVDSRFPAEAWPAHWQEVRRQGHLTFESVHQTKSGRTFPVEVTTKHLEYSGSEYACAIVQDVTDRKRAELALRDSEERYRALVQASPSAIMAIRNGRFVFVNPAAARMFGYADPSEVVGLDALSVVAPASRDLIAERIRKLDYGQANPPVEIELLRPDGTRICVDSVSVPVELHDGPASLIIGRDVTDRRRAEDALRESEHFARTIVAGVGEGVVVYDKQLRYLVWSKYMEEMTGVLAQDVLGKHALELFPHLREQGIDRLLERALAGETVHSADTLYRVPATGKQGYVVGLYSPLVTAEGKQVGVVATIQDVTERRRAEDERRMLQEQLHQAQKMDAIGQLAGGVAHDFNNLLTVIMGNAEFIGVALPEGSPQKSSLQMIMEAARQATGVTRSLLTFSQKIPSEKRPVDFGKAVTDACRFLGRILPGSVELVLDMESDTPLWVLADATQLQQVLLNLAINARDAMPDGGSLKVRLSPASPCELADTAIGLGLSGRMAQLEVSDSGTGMPPEVLSRIFEPFFTTKPRGRGTGLGLSIIHGIVKDHGGRIDVESQVGKGSTFRIVLPCVAPAPGGEAAGVQALPRGKGQGILIAEDNQFVREIMVSMLEQLGYDVCQASDGASLIEQCRSRRDELRLLILDIDLPKQSGLDCLRSLRSEGVHTPAIMITGSVALGIEEQLDDRTSLLRKPFQMSDLGAHVISVIEGSRPAETGA